MITWAERRSTPPARRVVIEDLLAAVPILPVDADVSRVFGGVRAQLLDAVRPTPGLDLLIAATALHHNLVMVTHNVSDYEHIPGLEVVDWLAP